MRKMKRIKVILSLGVTFLLFNACFAQAVDDPKKNPCIPCEEIKNVRLPDVIISQSEQLQEPVPHCKISGIIGAEIKFELLLPNDWNSRFVMGGGGGSLAPFRMGRYQV